MKKIIAIALVLLMILSFAACSTAKPETPAPQTGDEGGAEQTEVTGGGDTTEPAPSVAKAADGVLTIAKANIAITVNGKVVAMPFSFDELIAAGLKSPATSDYELSAGSTFMPNMYLDEAEKYVVSPNYDNSDGEGAVTLKDAKALGIRMASYADAPEDVGAELMGVKFGMSEDDVKAILGEPSDSSSGLYYTVAISDESDLEGSLTVTFTDGKADYVDLSIY